MRNLKFRAWDTGRGRWLTSTEIEESIEVNVIVRPEGTGVFEFYTSPFGCEVELQQFTGLCDKNGKEIYEGDILQAGPSGRLYPVSWCAFGAGFWAANGQFYHDPRRWPESEVIGNIHKNPELLEPPQ